MITEAKFKYALKDMMKTRPLEEVNVTLLCQAIGCHRQTFYYHYQDIYDLIAAILLNENLPEVEKAENPDDLFAALLRYIKENFSFLRATYNSAARDLADEFTFGKINAKLFQMWSAPSKPIGLKKEGARTVSRRYARIIADEFGFCFKDPKLTPERFANRMNKFYLGLSETILPALIAVSKKEETR